MVTIVQKLITVIRNLYARRLYRDSGLQFIFNLITAVFSFLQFPLLIKILGKTGFGELVIFQTWILIWAAVSIIRFDEAIIMKIPGVVDHVNSRLRLLLAYGIVSEVTSLFVGMIIITAGYSLISHSLVSISRYGSITLYCIAAGVLSMSFGALSSTFRVLGLYHKYLRAVLLSTLLRTTILFYAAFFSLQVPLALGAAFLLPELLRYAYLLFTIKDVFRAENTFRQSREEKAGNLKFAVWSTVGSWADLPITQFDKLILSSFVPVSYVGVYHLLRRIGLFVAMATSPFYVSIFHEFSEMINSKRAQAALRLFYKTIPAFAAASFCVAAAIFATKGIWYHKIFLDNDVSFYSIAAMLGIYVLACTFTGIHPLFTASGYVRQSAIIIAIANGGFFIFAILLAKAFGINGMIGALALQFVCVIVTKYLVLMNGRRQIESMAC